MFKNWTRQQWFSFICNNLLIVFGSILLALGTAVFLTRLEIVSGGLSGIGIIIQHFVGGVQIIDIVVWGATVVLWFVGFFFCGKEFAFKTLLSSLLYPLFLAIFLRNSFFQEIAFDISGGDNSSVGHIIICGLFAGVFVGSGVGLTFLGRGSTGGLDVLIFLFAKHSKVKESVWSFIIDGVIVLFSMIIIPDNWVNSLVGIISAFVTALMIDFIYNGNMSSVQADIISDKWEEISRFAQDELGRGATIIHAEGGYKGDPKIILRVVVDKRQSDKLIKFISNVDPHAFVTYTTTRAVFGEGFTPHK